MGLSILYGEIARWGMAQGARDLSKKPGLWHGETPEWEVVINGHPEMVDGIPVFHCRLAHKDQLVIALFSPYGGMIVGGYPEDKIIEHFKSEADRLEAEVPA